jgi:ATP-binding cassette subfamily B multidrug efflux pump
METFRPTFAKTLRPFLTLKPYFVKNRWALLLGLLSLLLTDLLQLLIPLVIKKAIDLLTLKEATPTILFRLGLLILGIALMIAFFRYVWRHLILGHSRKVEEAIRNRMYGHLQTLSFSFFQRTPTGDIMARAINDINAVRMASGIGLVALTDGAVLGMAAIGFMLSIKVKLTLISLIPAPIIVIFTRVLTGRMSAGFERVQATFSDLTESVREAFSGIRVIKAYNRESWEHRRVAQKGERYIEVNLHLARTLALFLPMMAIFTNTGLAIVVWLGGRSTILGEITTGDFVAFTSYLNLMMWPMMAMGWVTNLIQRGAASMGRINGILEEVPEIKDRVLPLRVPRIRGEVEIRDLTIQYPGQTVEALKSVRLKIDAGETVAVVGRVGSGKTTLLHAIPRLLDADSGTVCVDGMDVRKMPLGALRENIGFATQETIIFSDTIRNNVLFGRAYISNTYLEEALRAAHFLEEIQTFKKELDTFLGERGITLSGGQRQRLTVARAILGDPSILILDDALSMVDTQTEERILNDILQIRRNKTNIIVSHRISTIRRASRIAVLERGLLVEQGTHKDLLARGGIYSTLYEDQLLAQELGIGTD